MVCSSAENDEEHEYEGSCDEDEGHNAHGTACMDVSYLVAEQLDEIRDAYEDHQRRPL